MNYHASVVYGEFISVGYCFGLLVEQLDSLVALAELYLPLVVVAQRNVIYLRSLVCFGSRLAHLGDGFGIGFLLGGGLCLRLGFLFSCSLGRGRFTLACVGSLRSGLLSLRSLGILVGCGLRLGGRLALFLRRGGLGFFRGGRSLGLACLGARA